MTQIDTVMNECLFGVWFECGSLHHVRGDVHDIGNMLCLPIKRVGSAGRPLVEKEVRLERAKATRKARKLALARSLEIEVIVAAEVGVVSWVREHGVRRIGRSLLQFPGSIERHLRAMARRRERGILD